MLLHYVSAKKKKKTRLNTYELPKIMVTPSWLVLRFDYIVQTACSLLYMHF